MAFIGVLTAYGNHRSVTAGARACARSQVYMPYLDTLPGIPFQFG